MSSPLLPWLVFLPLLAGVVAFAIPVKAERFRAVFSTVVSAAAFLLGIAVLVGPEASYRAVALGFVDGYLVDFRIDVLNRFMVMFASLFGLLVTVFSIGYMQGRSRLREYYPYVLISIGAANGAQPVRDNHARGEKVVQTGGNGCLRAMAASATSTTTS